MRCAASSSAMSRRISTTSCTCSSAIRGLSAPACGIHSSRSMAMAAESAHDFEIAVELSLYPLTAEFIPTIKDFIDRLNAHPDLRVVTNSLSTQVFGPHERVFEVLKAE